MCVVEILVISGNKTVAIKIKHVVFIKIPLVSGAGYNIVVSLSFYIHCVVISLTSLYELLTYIIIHMYRINANQTFTFT